MAFAGYIGSMTKHEEQLIAQHSAQVFHGQTVRQDYPVCACGKIFDEKTLNDAPGVYFKEIDVFGKKFTLIEPVCPVCNRKIPASFNILN